jgi:hypothetical protein
MICFKLRCENEKKKFLEKKSWRCFYDLMLVSIHKLYTLKKIVTFKISKNKIIHIFF